MSHASLAIAAIVLLAGGVWLFAQGQDRPSHGRHRLVLEMTSEGAEQWEAVLNNAENVRKAFGAENVEIEVVVHGKGLGMLLKTDAGHQERIGELSKAGVVFAACENTMKRKNKTKEDLLPAARTVDSGVAELVRKQEAGWAYVKAGH